MIHHTLEDDLTDVCPNCGQQHNAQLSSIFSSGDHYAVGNCGNCGYRIEFDQSVLGSGLFLPNGDVSTVQKIFRKSQTEQIRTRLEETQHLRRDAPSHSRMRILDPFTGQAVSEAHERAAAHPISHGFVDDEIGNS
jgi:transcription elongation factor Elf1